MATLATFVWKFEFQDGLNHVVKADYGAEIIFSGGFSTVSEYAYWVLNGGKVVIYGDTDGNLIG